MCEYCQPDAEGDFKDWKSPNWEYTRARLDRYGDYEWTLVSVCDGGAGHYNIVEIAVNNCPWCGRELD